MKKWVLLVLSLLMVLMLAMPTMAQTGEPESAQSAGAVSTSYTVEFTYDGKLYVMPGDSSVRLSAVLDKVGLTGEAEAVEISDASLFSASNATEDICKDGIPAFGRHPHDIPVLHVYPVKHSAGRVDFQSIIKHIDVDFTANHKVITMDQGVDDTFSYRAFRVVRKFNPTIWFFKPSLVGVAVHECFPLL